MQFRLANKKDTGDIADIIYASGRELYDFLFAVNQTTALAFIEFEFFSGSGFCGHQNLTVAIEQEKVIATACCYNHKQYHQHVLGTIKNVFHFYPFFTALKILIRMIHIKSVMKMPKRDEFYISNFAVTEKLRGQGIGTAFLTHIIAHAKAQHYQRCCLDVAQTNPKAEALYSRLGFKIIRSKKFSAQKTNVPNANEMELKL